MHFTGPKISLTSCPKRRGRWGGGGSSSPECTMSSFKWAGLLQQRLMSLTWGHQDATWSSMVDLSQRLSETQISRPKCHWEDKWMSFNIHLKGCLSTTRRVKHIIFCSTTGSLPFWSSYWNITVALFVVVCVGYTQSSTVLLWPWERIWANS